MNIKYELSKEISKIINESENDIYNLIIKNEVLSRGNYSLPCFKFASKLKNSPQNIASMIEEKLNWLMII